MRGVFLLVVCGVLFGVFSTLAVQSYVVDSVVSSEVVVERDTVHLDVPSARYVFNASGVNANGFYSYDGYFCVITKNRSPDAIARTTFHELAHYFVDSDPEHFVSEHILERVRYG